MVWVRIRVRVCAPLLPSAATAALQGRSALARVLLHGAPQDDPQLCHGAAHSRTMHACRVPLVRRRDFHLATGPEGGSGWGCILGFGVPEGGRSLVPKPSREKGYFLDLGFPASRGVSILGPKTFPGKEVSILGPKPSREKGVPMDLRIRGFPMTLSHGVW